MAIPESVQTKLDRAEKHLKVASRLVRWFARNKCTVEAKPNPETHEIDAIARLGTPPQALSAIFGDAIHNMRSALDHIVYQLVLTNPDPDRPSGVPNDKTMFPICDTREGFQRQVNVLGRLRGIPDGACAFINRLQPYHRRDAGLDYMTHPLWVLNKLENIDKHRRLAFIAGAAIGHHALVRHPDGSITEHISHGATLLCDGTILWSFKPPEAGMGEMEVKGTLLSTVAFNEPDAGLVRCDAAGILWQIFDALSTRYLPNLASFLSS